MPEISPEVVHHVALLSRLELSEGEVQQFASDLSHILVYFEKLNELDTTGVPPTSHSFHMENVFREDVVKPSLTNVQALENAPEAEDACFKVPAVIQEA